MNERKERERERKDERKCKPKTLYSAKLIFNFKNHRIMAWNSRNVVQINLP